MYVRAHAHKHTHTHTHKALPAFMPANTAHRAMKLSLVALSVTSASRTQRVNSVIELNDDPSAGSPTETLLRLLPGSSHTDQDGFHLQEVLAHPQAVSPHFSRNGSVPGSDGRCVQRAGT